MMKTNSWWPFVGTLSWCPIMKWSHCISSEDWVPINFIYIYPIFHYVAVTWPGWIAMRTAASQVATGLVSEAVPTFGHGQSRWQTLQWNSGWTPADTGNLGFWKINCQMSCTSFTNMGTFYKHGLTLIPAWISNHIPSKLWDEITYPFPNFKSGTVEVWEWISNFIPYNIMDVITCPYWD